MLHLYDALLSYEANWGRRAKAVVLHSTLR